MTRMLRRNLKSGDESIPVPEEQALVYRICQCCDQQYPLDKFEQRGRPKKDGSKSIDNVCKYCRELIDKKTTGFVRQNAQRVDAMMLDLCEGLAQQPTDEFDDLPNIGTLTQAVLRPFGGAMGLGLQMASSYLSSPPGSACRQKTHSLLVKMATEASKLGYAKKTVEQMTDAELEEYLAVQQRKLLKQADGNDEDVKAEEEAEVATECP
jgi:hypothetical protein